ncbi:MAG: hypothetical protein ABJA37_06000 [Ferruginibacter sp.]
MNTLSKPLLILMLCLTTAVGYSQQKADTRPKLFASLPENIKVNDAVLKNAFTFFAGQDASIVLANNFIFSGTVITNEVKYSNLQNIIIRSASLNNSLLSISKIINADNSISYTGRIINNKAFDGFEIKRGEDGQYSLEKFETGRILQDCSY